MISTIENLVDTIDDVAFLEEILVECLDAVIYDSITDYKESTIKRGIAFYNQLEAIGVNNYDEFLIEFINDIGEEISESLVIDWQATWLKAKELHSIKKIDFEGSSWYFDCNQL